MKINWNNTNEDPALIKAALGAIRHEFLYMLQCWLTLEQLVISVSLSLEGLWGELAGISGGKGIPCSSSITYPPDVLGPRQIEESFPVPPSSLGKSWDQTLTLLNQMLYSFPSFKPCRLFKGFFLSASSYFEYQWWSYTNGFFSPFFFFQQSYNKGIHAREAAQMFCLLEPSDIIWVSLR